MKNIIVLRLKNPENFSYSTLCDFRFSLVEISISNYNLKGEPLYSVKCVPDSFDYLDGYFSYSLISLKNKIGSSLGSEKGNRLKWEKVK